MQRYEIVDCKQPGLNQRISYEKSALGNDLAEMRMENEYKGCRDQC